jgi:hypothetical protein
MALVYVSIELIAIYFHSFDIFNIHIGEMTFCQPNFIIIKSNYFQNAQTGQCFLDDFEALVREILRSSMFEVSEFKKVITCITFVLLMRLELSWILVFE